MFVLSLSTLTFVAYSLLLMHRTTARSTNESQPTARSTNNSQPTARSTKESQPTARSTNVSQPTARSTKKSQPTARSTKESQPTARSTNERQPTIHLPRNISNKTTIVTRSNLNETECKMSIKEEDWKKFLTLTEHSLVNIVDLHFEVEDNHTKYTRSMIWVNRVGGKLLLLLDIDSFSATLNVGRRNMKIHVETQPKRCVWFNNTEREYQVEMKLLNIFSRKIKPSEELCFTLRPNEKKPRQCCKVTRENNKGEYDYECYLSLGPPLGVYMTFELLLASFVFLSLLTLNGLYLYYLFLQQFPGNKDYYKLTDSPISLTNMVMKLSWREGAILKSLGYKSVLAYLSLFFLFFSQPLLFLLALVCIWLPVGKLSKSSDKILIGKRFFDWLIRKYEQVFGLDISNENEFQRAVQILTLPINVKLWYKIFPNLVNVVSTIDVTSNVIICVLVSLSFFACFLYIVFFIVFTAVIVCIDVVYNVLMLTASFNISLSSFVNYPCLYYSLLLLSTLFSVIFSGLLWFLVPFVILPLVSGIILNSVYFLPYVAFFSVVGFYTWRSWKSLKGEYFSLKMIIYEVLQDKQSSNINLDDVKDNERIVYVVSKKLYRKIRMRLLPYHTKFFIFSVKFALIVVFARGVIELVRILQAVDASPSVLVIAMLTTGALPHILNMVMATESDDEGKAHNKTMRANVECLVEKFTKNDSKLSMAYLTTTLIISEVRLNGDVEKTEELAVNGRDLRKNYSITTYL